MKLEVIYHLPFSVDRHDVKQLQISAMLFSYYLYACTSLLHQLLEKTGIFSVTLSHLIKNRGIIKGSYPPIVLL